MGSFTIRFIYPILSYLIFSDINECQSRNGGCQHGCIDTHGSYRCMCRDGFKLRSDKRSCDGKSTKLSIWLYIMHFFDSKRVCQLWNSRFPHFLGKMLNLSYHLHKRCSHGGICVTVLCPSTPKIYSHLVYLHSEGGTVHGRCHSASHDQLTIWHSVHERHWFLQDKNGRLYG